ncbi:MAG: general secretion pathway protein GspK, partial [Betaproteobacteria bacterium]|nr:general secretion pathway protein GspK [Betaproteobacteria bacterium]
MNPTKARHLPGAYAGEKRSQGAALLMALLTASLVASLAAAGVWLQWRSTEVEAAERQRDQAHWLLLGALDWARIILREDARAGGENGQDHLAEPWAVPLQEARLSTFISANADGVSRDDERLADEVFLSGQISDMQGRLNILNLLDNDGQLSKPQWAVLERLFKSLDLPEAELQSLGQQLVRAHTPNATARVLRPQRLEQLAWLGLSARTVQTLAPHVCVLPVRTAINLNTASAAVVQASLIGLDNSAVSQLMQQRESRHFESLEDLRLRLNNPRAGIDSTMHSVGSRYFEVRGRLRWGLTVLEERSLVERNGSDVRVVWSDRGLLAAP